MEQKKGKDFLIRNIPEEIYNLLEKNSKEHHRSKNQEAIIALTMGLSSDSRKIRKPVPRRWGKTRLTKKFIQDAIKEGRE